MGSKKNKVGGFGGSTLRVLIVAMQMVKKEVVK
jgi:hypothetical protein